MAQLNDIEKEIVKIVTEEAKLNDESVVFITEKVGIAVRPLIRILRKNYMGVFDEQYDPITKRKKIWEPLTETFVEHVFKNIDLDAKDVGFRSRNGRKGIPTTDLVRGKVREYLENHNFGEQLDELERQLCIDGTAIWKTWEGRDAKGRINLNVKLVDRLNFYIDPTANNIQDAYRVVERAVLTEDEVKSMDGWNNTEDVEAEEGVPRLDAQLRNSSHVTTKGVEVYELWGKAPKWVLTGKKNAKDAMSEVDIHAVVSNPHTDPIVHLVEENTNTDRDGNVLKPYEEVRYTKFPGRWDGRGIAEKLMMLQLYVNIVKNLRINKNYLSQLGLFKIRRGSGITAAMLKNLVSNGVVQVNQMDDIENMVIAEAGATSYKDEETIQNTAQRLTAAFEVVTGEGLPSSTPATNAVIQNRNAQSSFTPVKEQIGMFLQRWMDRHALPIISKTITKGDIIRIFGDVENIDKIRERVVAKLALMELEKDPNFVPSQEALAEAMANAQRKLREDGDLFIETVQKIVTKGIDTRVVVTNEEVDVPTTTSNLVTFAQLDPENRDHYIALAMDLLGQERPSKPATQGLQQRQIPSNLPLQPGTSEQALVTEANVNI